MAHPKLSFSIELVQFNVLFGFFSNKRCYSMFSMHGTCLKSKAIPTEFSGAGANAGKESSPSQIVAANVAKDCLAAAVKADSKSGCIWVNLADAYSMVGDYRSAAKCLEQVPICLIFDI